MYMGYICKKVNTRASPNIQINCLDSCQPNLRKFLSTGNKAARSRSTLFERNPKHGLRKAMILSHIHAFGSFLINIK